jgi:hypothetical protein
MIGAPCIPSPAKPVAEVMIIHVCFIGSGGCGSAMLPMVAADQSPSVASPRCGGGR